MNRLVIHADTQRAGKPVHFGRGRLRPVFRKYSRSDSVQLTSRDPRLNRGRRGIERLPHYFADRPQLVEIGPRSDRHATILARCLLPGAHHVRFGSELLVIAEADIGFEPQPFHQHDPRGAAEPDLFGQPDLAVDSRELQVNVSAFAQPNQKRAQRDRVDTLGLNLHRLVIVLRYPDPAFHFEIVGRLLRMAAVTGAGPSLDHPSLYAVNLFFTDEPKIECIGDVFEFVLPGLSAVLPCGDSLLGLFRRFLAADRVALFEVLLLFLLFFGRERHVIAADQSAVGRPLEQGYIPGFRVAMLDRSRAIEEIVLLPFEKGIAARDLIIALVELERAADDFPWILAGRMQLQQSAAQNWPGGLAK